MIALEDLAESVLEKTREGKLTWTELSATGYHSNIGPNSITIDQFIGGIGGGTFALRFTNDKGTVIQTIHSSPETHAKLKEIYALARRQALRVDETLLTIKRALDSL